MSGAVVNADGGVRQLDAKAEAPIVITAEDAADKEKLARLLQQALRDLAELRRRHSPKWLDFEDVTLSTGDYEFPHGFRGRVRWWVVDWLPDASADPVALERSADSTADTLVLSSFCDGVATIRVEEVP
jgi:hypothetical protein